MELEEDDHRYANDEDREDLDAGLIGSSSQGKKKTIGGIDMFRSGSKAKSFQKRKPSAGPGSSSSSPYSRPSIPTPNPSSSTATSNWSPDPKLRRISVYNPLAANKDKSILTEQIYAPDDGRGIKSTTLAKMSTRDSLPKTPPRLGYKSSKTIGPSLNLFRSFSMNATTSKRSTGIPDWR
ncbi:UNVERIFIED_CONTAM: hypothetical protein HDU68_008979 [Siphonaria sp. JEL0065]|nr:hypothetical protein HDU68_008979 [Siphonaria sp. JEL0065]